MQIEWIEDLELEIVESFDEENEIVESVNQIIHKGEKDDIDVTENDDNDSDSVNIQFGNGSVAFNVPKSLFKVL